MADVTYKVLAECTEQGREKAPDSHREDAPLDQPI